MTHSAFRRRCALVKDVVAFLSDNPDLAAVIAATRVALTEPEFHVGSARGITKRHVALDMAMELGLLDEVESSPYHDGVRAVAHAP